MPLTLVTGPANAEKAGFVLSAYRAALDAEPLLVVPTFADVDHYRRELAGAGAVFGVQATAFHGLMEEIARRAGVGGRPISQLTRERVAAAAVARARLQVLARSAATPGFPGALLRLVDELEERRIAPGRWWAAMREWGEREPSRAAYAEELARLYGAYRDGLQALGRRDPVLADQAALDALRLAPARWRGTPVFVYGFDDLTAVQRDAIETLAGHAQAPVMVSLAYEPGRVAFAGRGETFQVLMMLGPEHVELPPRAEFYERPALHALERGLFEATSGKRPDPGDALLLLEGGGERAEIELVGAHVARLLREGGYAPEDVAVVVREPADQAALIEQVFTELEIPFALERRIPAGHTAVGRGVVGLLRCALGDGSADDLLAWLRTPGKLEQASLADRLEQRARRDGAASAEQARALWESEHPDFVLHELDRVAGAASDPAALCRRLAAETAALFAAPYRRQARVLAGPEALDARVAAALRKALADLERLAGARRSPLFPSRDELVRVLSAVEVRAHDRPRSGVVEVTSPGALRARRVRALFLCGLREDAFPRPPRPEPFLGDDERRGLNAASGLRLRLREDRLDAERYLLYAAVSRPTDLLALSWPAADDEGEPCVRSLFVDDVLDVFAPKAAQRVERRALGAAGFDDDLAPTENARARHRLVAGPGAPEPHVASLRDPRVLEGLRARSTWSASGLEAYASCPVKWFVERLLRPSVLEPDPEPMLRGELAHRVLEDALRALSGGGPLTPARIDEARAHVRAALDQRADDARISPNAERRRTALRRLEVDLLRYVEQAATSGSAFSPAEFELRFGGADDPRPPAELAGGELRLEGRIDRIDVGPGGEAIVYDYKGKGAPPQAKWLSDARLQVGLYVLALPQLLEREAVGGLYQPLGRDDDGRPRGLLREDADPDLRSVPRDRLPDEEFEERLAEVLDAALAAVRGIRSGALAPAPEACAWGGGCAHPEICRCETT